MIHEAWSKKVCDHTEAALTAMPLNGASLKFYGALEQSTSPTLI